MLSVTRKTREAPPEHAHSGIVLPVQMPVMRLAGLFDREATRSLSPAPRVASSPAARCSHGGRRPRCALRQGDGCSTLDALHAGCSIPHVVPGSDYIYKLPTLLVSAVMCAAHAADVSGHAVRCRTFHFHSLVCA